MRDTKIAELSEELSQFKGAVPGYSPSADTGSEPVSMDEMSHLEAAKTIDFAAG